MVMLLKIGEVYLIISAMASTFYVMIGMHLTDRVKLPQHNHDRRRTPHREHASRPGMIREFGNPNHYPEISSQIAATTHTNPAITTIAAQLMSALSH